jgi:hypothetical protein
MAKKPRKISNFEKNILKYGWIFIAILIIMIIIFAPIYWTDESREWALWLWVIPVLILGFILWVTVEPGNDIFGGIYF